jgi:hypothetical protein
MIQDGVGALRLWLVYLLHVQSFLSDSIPEYYHSLTVHQYLFEFHQNLLTTQHPVLLSDSGDPDVKLDKGLSENKQFNLLTILHNETLASIKMHYSQIQDN